MVKVLVDSCVYDPTVTVRGVEAVPYNAGWTMGGEVVRLLRDVDGHIHGTTDCAFFDAGAASALGVRSIGVSQLDQGEDWVPSYAEALERFRPKVAAVEAGAPQWVHDVLGSRGYKIRVFAAAKYGGWIEAAVNTLDGASLYVSVVPQDATVNLYRGYARGIKLRRIHTHKSLVDDRHTNPLIAHAPTREEFEQCL